MVKKKHYFRIIKEELEAQNFIETFQKMKARFPEIQKQTATASPEKLDSIRKIIEQPRGIANSSARFSIAHSDSNQLSQETIDALTTIVKECDTLLSTLAFTRSQADGLNALEDWLQEADKED